MRFLERRGHLGDLATALGRTEVDRRADAGGSELMCSLDGAEHDLVVGGRVGQQLVVVDLDDERDAVGIAAGNRSEHAECRGHGIAAALDRQLHDGGRIEVDRVWRERRGTRVLDALIHRKDRNVTGAAEATVVEQRLEAPHDLRRTVGAGDDIGYKIGPGQRKQVAPDAFAFVVQQIRGLLAQQAHNVSGHDVRFASHCLTAPVLELVPRTGTGGGARRMTDSLYPRGSVRRLTRNSSSAVVAAERCKPILDVHEAGIDIRDPGESTPGPLEVSDPVVQVR